MSTGLVYDFPKVPDFAPVLNRTYFSAGNEAIRAFTWEGRPAQSQGGETQLQHIVTEHTPGFEVASTTASSIYEAVQDVAELHRRGGTVILDALGFQLDSTRYQGNTTVDHLIFPVAEPFCDAVSALPLNNTATLLTNSKIILTPYTGKDPTFSARYMVDSMLKNEYPIAVMPLLAEHEILNHGLAYVLLHPVVITSISNNVRRLTQTAFMRQAPPYYTSEPMRDWAYAADQAIQLHNLNRVAAGNTSETLMEHWKGVLGTQSESTVKRAWELNHRHLSDLTGLLLQRG